MISCILLILVALGTGIDVCHCSYVILLPKKMSYGVYPISVSYLKPIAMGIINGEVKVTDLETKDVLIMSQYQLTAANCVSSCPVSGIVNIQVGSDLTKYSYKVEITGTTSGREIFQESTTVKFERKPLNIFIQTDRAVYKPSQTVNFRILTVDADLKPKSVMLAVTIHDPRDNIIKQWQKESEHAMFTDNFLLSDEPMNGDWKIKVVTEEEDISKIFEVREYVLPKFEVAVAPPGFLLTTSREIPVTVTAKYTYGKPVKGTCELHVRQEQYPWEIQHSEQVYIKDLRDGKAEFEASTVTQPRNGRKIHFSAVCTESLTNNAITANTSVKVYSMKYKLKFLEVTSGNFKPGMTYKAYVLLSQADGTSPKLSDLKYIKDGIEKKRQITLEIKMGFYYYGSSTVLKNYTADVDSAGLAVFEISMEPGWNTQTLQLEAKFYDGSRTLRATKHIESFFTRDQNYLQVNMMGTSSRVKIDELTEFKIKTSFMSSLFHVVLFSRGQIVSAQDMKMIDNTEHIYKLIVNEDIGKKLSPNCQMIVWTVTDADELLADSIQFSIDGAFSNQLQVSINPIDSQQVTPTEKLVRAKPGDEVTVRVKAKPLSYFGLLVVDQASRALGSNDITQKEVLSVLQSQDDDVSDYPWRSSFFDPVFFFRSSGARNSKEIIQNSGLFIKTDVYIDEGHVTSPPTSTYPEWTMAFMTTAFRPTKMEVPQIGKPDDELDKSPEIPKDRENADTHGLAEVKRIRKDFPETWIFLDGKVNSHGLFSTSSTVPDSITTWIATAFSIHPEKGLGVLDQPFELQAFKPFFVTMDLPYSIIRGEEFELKIIVQNYLKSSVDVKITLEKSKDYFKVSPPSGGKYQFAKVWTDIVVPPGDGYTVSIWIKPVELGNIPIEVKAQSSQMADAVLRKILVKPEGAPQEYTKNVLIQSKDITTFVEKVDVELPVDVLVPDSLRVYASLVGDIMGPAMNNLDHLIRMPYGCGEQNMLNFAPNIFIMDYLKATDQSNPKVVENAMKYSEIGYQKELNYQRKDGCFSAFGNSDKEGSTWLTAFVLKSFWRGRPYLSQSVNSDMEKGLECLITKQTKSGQFVENGVIYHKAMQGGTSSGVTLTAYVLITLLEIKDIMLEDELSSSFTAAVSSAESYLMSKLNDPDIQNDPYTLAVVGYAFSLGNQGETTQRIFDSLKDLAKHENGQMYWDEKQQSSSPDKSEMWNYHKASTHKVEIAAYALLMYVKLDKYLDGLPITNWLIDQRNPNGGYRSTQDTVMALQALTEIAIRVYGDIEPSMDVTIERNVNEWSFPKLLTSDTQLLLQTLELDLPIQQHSELQVKAKGKGTALVQITVKYNIYRIKADTKIKLNVTSEEKVDGITNVNICTSYLGEGDSGMVVIETMPLSGYKFVDMENVRKSADELKRVEQNDDKTVLYLDTVKKDDICLQLTQERVNFVANIKKSRTLAYSYYDTDETDSAFYLPQAVNARSICDTCSECCSEKSDYVLHFDVERRINGVSGMAPMINITFPAFVCILFHYAVN